MNTKRGRGRPKCELGAREAQIAFFLTDNDAKELEDLAARLGFKSRSQLCTAIFERLLIGGFSGLVWLKLGWMFSNLIDRKGITRGFYFGGPLPPLIGDEEDPSGPEIVPFLEELKKEARKEKSA